MNFVIAKFVTFALVLVVISGANVRPKQQSLNEAYKIMKESMDADADKNKGSHMVLHQTNYDCITETLKLSENGDKLMDTRLADDYVLTAILKCYSDEGLKEFIEFSFDTLVHNLDKTDNLRCNKVMLQKMDPTSKLIENFDKDITNEEVMACDTLIPAKEYNFVKTCVFSRGADNACYEESEIKKSYHLALVMAAESNEEIIKAETSRYVDNLYSKFSRFVSCSMKSLM